MTKCGTNVFIKIKIKTTPSLVFEYHKIISQRQILQSEENQLYSIMAGAPFEAGVLLPILYTLFAAGLLILRNSTVTILLTTQQYNS